jgi:hypothetical protein
MPAGHGGQALLSERTAGLVEEEFPRGVSLLDLGRSRAPLFHSAVSVMNSSWSQSSCRRPHL